MKKNKKIAVVYGGFSNEREISLKTGENCYNSLIKLGYDACLIDLTRDIPNFIKIISDFNPDVIFNALHGTFGEDGCVQGLFDLLAIPYTHSGVLASSIAMDKDKAKSLFNSIGIPTAKGIVGNFEDVKNYYKSGKAILKPVNEGSSVGIYLISSKQDFDNIKWNFEKAMLEEYIEGREITVGIINNDVLGISEIITDRIFYNYDAKYSDGGSKHIKIENISDLVIKKLENYALMAHKVIGCNGITRCDFRYDEKNDKLALLEINTQPGMTNTSLIPDIAKLKGISYEDIIEYMVESAVCKNC